MSIGDVMKLNGQEQQLRILKIDDNLSPPAAWVEPLDGSPMRWVARDRLVSIESVPAVSGQE